MLPGLEFHDGKVVGTLAVEAAEAPANVAPPSMVMKPRRLELACDDARCSMRVRRGWAYLQRDEEVLAVVSVGARNFFPTMEVLRQTSSWNLS